MKQFLRVNAILRKFLYIVSVPYDTYESLHNDTLWQLQIWDFWSLKTKNLTWKMLKIIPPIFSRKFELKYYLLNSWDDYSTLYNFFSCSLVLWTLNKNFLLIKWDLIRCRESSLFNTSIPSCLPEMQRMESYTLHFPNSLAGKEF